MKPDLQELKRNLACDRNTGLGVLRRELANWMFSRDPDRYLLIYKQAHDVVGKINAAKRSDQQAELSKLTDQYPFYTDFDLVGTRDHVLYADALDAVSYDDAEHRYADIIRFQALKILLDDNWWGFHATSAQDMAHLEEYVTRFKDTRFKNRLKNAIRELHAHQRNTNSDRPPEARASLYEADTFSVRPVPHFAEIRYGVHFKDTNEFGLYTIFLDDSSKAYIGFYRSDAGFREETVLDDLRIDAPL